MKRLIWTGMVCGLLVLAVLQNVEAGKYNPTRSLGDPFAGFENLPSVSGQAVSLIDFEKADVLVIVTTCNSCPYAVEYEQRFQEFHQKYADNPRVQFIAINCNLVKDDSLEEMKQHAEKAGLTFPYLFDESQETGKDLGALRTPECFVLNRERKIIYMGAFDDSTDASQVKQQYVQEAVNATLKGEAVEIAETPPIGCLIRYKRRR